MQDRRRKGELKHAATWCLALFLANLVGCSGLQEMWEGPGAETFRPTSIAVLPPMASQYDSAREEVQELLGTSLKKTKRFENILPVDEVTDSFQASKEGFDALVVLFSRLDNTGQADREAAQKVGKVLKVDALCIVRVNAWEYLKTETENQGKVRLTLHLVDTNTGTIVWKARHERTSSYLFFKPNLRDVASELSDDMLRYLPRPKPAGEKKK